MKKNMVRVTKSPKENNEVVPHRMTVEKVNNAEIGFVREERQHLSRLTKIVKMNTHNVLPRLKEQWEETNHRYEHVLKLLARFKTPEEIAEMSENDTLNDTQRIG